MEKEAGCSGYWQPVDRETETVITGGQLETQKQGQESRTLPDGHTASNMSSGLCDHSCLC